MISGFETRFKGRSRRLFDLQSYLWFPNVFSLRHVYPDQWTCLSGLETRFLTSLSGFSLPSLLILFALTCSMIM